MRKMPGMMLLSLLACPGAAEATYSIVATDGGSGQVGGSGTSCVGAMSVTVIYGSAPGHGAVHAQSWVNEAGRDRAVVLLGSDTPPEDIIADITSATFDPMASRRQYGVVDLSGRAAGYTGEANGDYAADIQGSVGTFTYSVQGNILTSRAVLENAEAAFVEGGCDLADRLMLSLEAGATGGEGDSRCTPGGIPSDSGFIHVDLEDGTEYLHISVTDTAPDSPLPLLRAAFDLWRSDHPCPVPPDDTEDASADPDGDPSDDPASDPAIEPARDEHDDPSLDAADGPGRESLSTGCGCRVAPRSAVPGPPIVLALLIAGLVGRNRPDRGGGHGREVER